MGGIAGERARVMRAFCEWKGAVSGRASGWVGGISFCFPFSQLGGRVHFVSGWAFLAR
jgi:hypothetical protein